MAWALKVGCARNGHAKHTYIHHLLKAALEPSGRGCAGPHWCHLVWFLQSVSSMAFLYCHQPRLGYVWKIAWCHASWHSLMCALALPWHCVVFSSSPVSCTHGLKDVNKQYRLCRTDGPSSKKWGVPEGRTYIHTYIHIMSTFHCHW
jgi:hypothetical protein